MWRDEEIIWVRFLPANRCLRIESGLLRNERDGQAIVLAKHPSVPVEQALYAYLLHGVVFGLRYQAVDGNSTPERGTARLALQ